MALRNRDLQEENKLKGADRSKDATKFKLGQFRTLENWIPAHVYSIKKKRGVEVLISEPNTPQLPLICAECTDATERGQQIITIETRFDQFNSFPPHGNIRTSWGYITAEEAVHTLVGDAAGSGGNMAYNATDCQRNFYQTPSIVSHPALIDPNDFLPFLNTTIGTSDEPIYGCRSSGQTFECYFPDSSTHVTYTLPVDADGLTATTVGGENMFAKRGGSIYFPCHATVFPFDHHIVEFNAVSGAVLNNFTSLPQFVHTQMSLTQSFLYVLAQELADTTQVSVKKISRSDGSVVATFMIDNIVPAMIGVHSDNLIYILCSGTPAALYYIKNFTDLVYVGNTTGQGFTPIGNITGTFVGGAFYYGANAVGGFSPDIYKVSVECPDGAALIATANRGAASVAAGATITASWADVLEPDALDRIQLHSAPVGGDLGFTAASLINSQLTDGLGTSSIVYTIPGGTPPGTYVFMYAALNSIYVASSPTFTVT